MKERYHCTSGELVKISKLKLWKDNPNKDKSVDAIDKLARLIAKHGQRVPIIVRKKTMVVYKGNHTLRALKKIGWKKIVVDFQSFPSEAAAAAFGASDNISSNWTEQDPDALLKMMEAEEITSEDVGLEEKEYVELTAAGGFATKSFAEAAEEFEKRHKGEKKKSAFWFWFEVPNEGAFEAVKELYARRKNEGKRMHRELGWDRMSAKLGIAGKNRKPMSKK